MSECITVTLYVRVYEKERESARARDKKYKTVSIYVLALFGNELKSILSRTELWYVTVLVWNELMVLTCTHIATVICAYLSRV